MFTLKWKRKFRQRLVIFSVNKLIETAVKMILWERGMAKQDDCKHEGQSGTYCGLCGKQLEDPDAKEERNLLKQIIGEVLDERGISKKTPDAPKTRKTLAERIGRVKK